MHGPKPCFLWRHICWEELTWVGDGIVGGWSTFSFSYLLFCLCCLWWECLVVIKMLWAGANKVNIKEKQKQISDLGPGSMRNSPESICLFCLGVFPWVRPTFRIHGYPAASKGYQVINSPSGWAGGVSVNRDLLRLCVHLLIQGLGPGEVYMGLNSAVCVGGNSLTTWRDLLRWASFCAVFQLAHASWGNGAPGVVVQTSASLQPVCGGALCSRSLRTVGRPAHPWKREPAAWSTPPRRARTAGTPMVLLFSWLLLLLSVMTFWPLHPIKGHMLCQGKFHPPQGVGWARLPKVDRKLRKCLIKELWPAVQTPAFPSLPFVCFIIRWPILIVHGVSNEINLMLVVWSELNQASHEGL